MADAGELKARATLDNSEFLAALQGIAANVEKAVQTSSDTLKGMQEAFGKVTDAVGKLAALGGLTAFAKEALDAANQTAKLEAGFKAILGPGEETRALFEKLKGMELTSLFDFEKTLGPAAKNMLMLGVSADQTAKTMKAVVDAAAGLKEGPEYINEVTSTIATMQSHLVASQKDMKALQKEGVDAWGALAREIGTSVPEAQEKVKKGLISSQTVTEAVTKEMGDRFAGAAERSTDSWKGAMHILDETGKQGMEALGKTIKDILTEAKPIIEGVSKALKELSDWWTGLSGPVKQAIVIIVGVTGAVIALQSAFGALKLAAAALSLNPTTLAVSAALAALVLLGKWVYENWPAIKAVMMKLWDGIAEFWGAVWKKITDMIGSVVGWIKDKIDALSPVIDFLKKLFSPLIAVWTVEWNLIVAVVKKALGWVFDLISGLGGALDKFIGWIKGIFGKMPGAEQLKGLGSTWEVEQKKLEAAKTATDAKTKSDEAAAAASAKQRISAQQAEGQELAAANAAKGAAEERKKAAEEAKKAAAEQQKLAEGVRKGYEALRAVAPDVAAAFAASMGGLREDASKTAEVFGTAWAKMSRAQKDTAIETLALGAALKGLGVTSEAGFQNAEADAEKFYRTVQTSSRSTAADAIAAQNAVIAAYQKHADFLNSDLKKAYEQGKMSADAYYAEVVNRAQAALDATLKLAAEGKASESSVLAARQQVAAATKALAENTAKEVSAAYAAIGEKSKQDLDKSTQQWAEYYATLVKTAGAGSRQAAEAELKTWEAVRARLQAEGKDFTDAQMAQFEALKLKVESLKDPVQRVADAFKLLGVTPMKALQQNLTDLTKALLDLQNATGKNKPAFEDLYAAQKKVDEVTQQIIDRMSQPWKDAHERGEVTATEMYQHIVAEAQKYLAQLVASGDRGPEALAKIKAATDALAVATKKAGDSVQKDINDAYHSIGMKSTKELDDQLKAATEIYGQITKEAVKSPEAILQAWIVMQKALKADRERHGVDWSKEDQKQLNDAEARLKKYTQKAKDVWGDLFKEIKSLAEKFKNDVIDKIFDRMFGKDPNAELKKQEADLQASLVTRAKEWDTYVADNAKQLQSLTDNYNTAMEKEASDTQAALDDAQKQYDDYAATVSQNIDGIKQKHADAAAAEVKAADDALHQKQQDYEDFAKEVGQNIEDIKQKWADQLEQQTDSLRKELDDQRQTYEDFVRDTNKTLARVGEDTATNIQDETENTKTNIEERQKDYQRYAEDTAKKIAEVRAKNNGTYSSEEDDLQTSLRRKGEDLQDYIDEQNRNLDRYTRDQKTRQDRETEDLKTSLADKTRDFDEFQADNAKKQEQARSDYQKGLDTEVQQQVDSLAQKKKDLDDAIVTHQTQLDQIQASHQKEQDAEIQAQVDALTQKAKDFETAKTGILQKSEEQKNQIKADYQQSTTDLHTELEKQKADYAAFVADIIGPGGKLDQLKAQHTTIWGDIASLATAAMGDIAKSILHVASDEVIGVLTGKTTGLKGILTDLGKILDDVLGKTEKVTESASTPLPSGGGSGGGGGGAASAVGNSLTGWIGAISGAVTAISSVISNFQQAKMETTLNAIEHNTRYTMMYVGERADGGILGELFRIGDEIAFGYNTKATENLRDLFKDWIGVITPIQQAIQNQIVGLAPYIVDTKVVLEDIRTIVGNIETAITTGPRAVTINISPQGLTTAEAARALGNQIAQNLSTQLVQVS